MAIAPDPERPPRGGLYDLGTFFHQIVSLAAHAAFLGAAAIASPSLAATGDDARTEQAMFVIRQTFITTAERDREPIVDLAERDSDGRSRSDSRCGEDGGSSGDPASAEADSRYGVAGPSDNPDPHLARSSLRAAGWWFFPGYTESIPSAGGDPAAPTMPWGRDDSLGNDPESARAGMWGEVIGTAWGSPGVGVGKKHFCETCGDSGRGRGRETLDGTAGAGATDTESTWMAASGSAL